MKTNIGHIDRLFRIVVGIFILSLAFWGPVTYFGYLGLVPLLTGLLGVCPVYSMLDINTCFYRGQKL